MNLKSKKESRKDIRALSKQGKELYDYLVHLSEILVDPPAHDLHEREMHSFKREVIDVLKKIDENANRIIGHLDYEEVRHEAFTKTFKLDQYHEYNVHIKNNNHR